MGSIPTSAISNGVKYGYCYFFKDKLNFLFKDSSSIVSIGLKVGDIIDSLVSNEHNHLNKSDLDLVSGTNTGDQVASTVPNDSTVPGSAVSDALERAYSMPATNKYYVDGTNGDDLTANGEYNKPFKTIQACLNYIGQPVTKADYMRTIEIYISDALTSQSGSSPQTWNGVYEENLVVPNRAIVFYGDGIKIGDNSGSGYGNILKEYSASRRFGAGSSDFRPSCIFYGKMNVRDSHNRLRDGFHIGGTCRTSILRRNLSSIQGNGTNQVTVEVAAGQFYYPITIPTTYPTEPRIRIAITGTSYYNATYDITSKIDDTHFIATRVSGSNTHTETEVSGSFYETDSAGASGLSHDSGFVNCYMQGAYTCDDGTVNGAAVTAGTEVLYAINSRFYTGIEGRTILCQRFEDNTIAGTNIVNSFAGMFNCSFSGSLTTNTFTFGTDDQGWQNCRFNSAVVFTVNNAGQTVRMDLTTFNSFIKTGCTWATNTPTLDLLGQPWSSGAWASRPTFNLISGQMYFDTGLKKPFYYNSSDASWYDAAGVVHP